MDKQNDQCECEKINWPKAVIKIVECLCTAVVIIAVIKYC